MARQERAIRTRRAFLEAAAEVFNEHGYDAATIAAILEKVRLTRGALYFHFNSKEDLARGVLDEAVTSDGLTPQLFKLQEWVDIGLLLAYRLPREPLLSASIRLSVDPKARELFGTRWPDWITLSSSLLAEAKERGELLPHADPVSIARLFVGSWTGVQLVAESVPEQPDLSDEISSLLDLVLPSVAVPGVLAKLDTSAGRAERLLAAAEARSEAEAEAQAEAVV
ncbi:ScbR family autoregulator-binding transcription factor [Streptomyces sp. SP18CS02]|uniref:ScbR family autoregulator-binding transcription factor n=1 Tax=Streptomyces sp. SP18CS02 TaxID=3002531 RepID=UPI002E77DE86|nr:ScbR family autoregulator-binding transcription factor [Streptomyces sp. SP18CS02]MEE1757457.1 ScbR family autoregulator-binding transcription factor [Streptomyces sp. SP18CS02]